MKYPIRVSILLAAYEILRVARRLLIKGGAPRTVVQTIDDALQELQWEIPSDDTSEGK